MGKYLWLVFLLILVYIIVTAKTVNGHNQFSMAINALSGANVKTIQALQGKLGH